MLTRVFDTSPSEGLSRLVLIALADYADDDGVCWPAIASIAKKARCAESTVHRALKRLAESGEIEIHLNAKDKGVNLYRLVAAAGEQLRLGVSAAEGSHGDTGARVTPKPSVPRTSISSQGTDGSGSQSGRGVRETPPSVSAELKAIANQAKSLWGSERERHRRRSGEAFARFTDQKALGNLVLALGRALKVGTWADIEVAIRTNASKPESNPWYLDEWTREAAGRRAEAEALQRKMLERDREELELRHRSTRGPKPIGEILPAALREIRSA